MESDVLTIQSEGLTTAHQALGNLAPLACSLTPFFSLPCSLCFSQVCFLNPKARCIPTSGPLQLWFSTSLSALPSGLPLSHVSCHSGGAQRVFPQGSLPGPPCPPDPVPQSPDWGFSLHIADHLWNGPVHIFDYAIIGPIHWTQPV